MKTTKEKIEVMIATTLGKIIQARPLNESKGWYDISKPSWNWYKCDYRIKPAEPKVIYVNEYGDIQILVYIGHITKEKALKRSSAIATRTAVKYQEVIEE